MKKLLQSEKRGSAIPLAVVAVVILLAMGMGLLRLGLNSRIFSIRTASDIAARCAADAGLAKALFEMNEKLKVKPWDDSILPQATNETLPNSDATFSYTVTDNLDGTYSVDVTGRCGQAIKRVGSTLFSKSIFQHALLAQSTIKMESEYLVDAYNSNDGPYGGANALQSTTIATNSTSAGDVAMDGSGTLYGDVVIGADVDLPQISAPTSPPFDVSKGAIGSTTTISADGQYDSIYIENGTLIINGDITLYVTGDVQFENSNLNILPDSSLTLYAGATFYAQKPTVQINGVTKEPKRFELYGVGGIGQTIYMEHGTSFYGVIYAPDAYVHIEDDAHVYGAIVAKDIYYESFPGSPSTLHYDKSLAEGSFGGLGAEFAVKCWWEE